MQLSSFALRSLRDARLRVNQAPRLSPLLRLGYIARHLHQRLAGNNKDGDADDGGALQEDGVPEFHRNFFPVRLGQVFNGRYQSVRKMHWDRSWTFWLCLDQRTNRYVSLKVSTAMPPSSDNHPVARELHVYRHIHAINSSHPGRSFIHPLLDTFEISRSDGRLHVCLVYPPVPTYARHHKNDVKSEVYSILQALDFLHTEANITHCNISRFHTNWGVDDHRLFDVVVDEEIDCPNEPYMIKGHPIYTTDAVDVATASYTIPTLGGFEHSRIASIHQHTPELIQPEYYRAPEIVLQTHTRSHAVDIWNLGCFACWSVQSLDPPFWPYDKEGNYSAYLHLAQIISIFGPPPRELLNRSPLSPLLFNGAAGLKPLPELDLNAVNRVLHPTRAERLGYLSRSIKMANSLSSATEAYPAEPLPTRSLSYILCGRDQGEERDDFVDFRETHVGVAA